MNDQEPASVADALNYTSGVITTYRGNSNRNDEVISRGFRYAPKLLDGLHFGLSSQNGGAGQIDPGCWSAWRWCTARPACCTARSAPAAWW